MLAAVVGLVCVATEGLATPLHPGNQCREVKRKASVSGTLQSPTPRRKNHRRIRPP